MSSHLSRLAFTCADGGHVEVGPKATVHIKNMCPTVQQLPALSIGSVPEKYVSQHVITLKRPLLLHIANAIEKRYGNIL